MYSINDDTKILIGIMGELLQSPEEAIVYNRNGIIPFARAIIAEWLVNKGYTKVSVGKVLHKDHSTIIAGLNRLKSILNIPGYKDVRELREKFIRLADSAIEEHEIHWTPCVWKVPQKDRLCEYCTVQNCTSRKS